MPQARETEGSRLSKKLAEKAQKLAGPSGLPKSKFMPGVARQVAAHGGSIKKEK